MKNSRICNLLFAALIVLLVAGAVVALVPQLTRTNMVLQARTGAVPSFDTPVPWPPPPGSFEGPVPWPPSGSFEGPVPWPPPGGSIGSIG